MKLRCIEKYFANVTYGKMYDVIAQTKSYIWIMNDKGEEQQFDTIESYFEILTDNAPSYYNNEKGSLYKFAEDHGLNAYEFEIIKRVVRCRKKKEFVTDIEKTIFLLELYMKEQGEKYKNERENLNK